jgi:large subunit ribosomal protein L5
MATDTRARLKSRYETEIRPALIERFGYSTPMQAPEIKKITLNMGVGDAKQDTKVLEAATEQLATIAGQRPSVRRARKSIAAFKLREGMPVGVSVTLRGERSYEFLDRLMSVAIPRIRDFRGMNPRSFDGRGNYSLGVREQIIFPEIDYDAIDQTRGLDITITTSAKTDLEAFVLLQAFGFPFAAEGRPAGAEIATDEPAAVPDAPVAVVEAEVLEVLEELEEERAAVEAVVEAAESAAIEELEELEAERAAVQAIAEVETQEAATPEAVAAIEEQRAETEAAIALEEAIVIETVIELAEQTGELEAAIDLQEAELVEAVAELEEAAAEDQAPVESDAEPEPAAQAAPGDTPTEAAAQEPESDASDSAPQAHSSNQE